MTETLTEADRRILRRYGALERDAVDPMLNVVREAERRWKAAGDLAYQMDFFRRFAPNWAPPVRIRPETIVAMQDAAASSTSVRGMNEPLPPLLNRAARRAMRKKGRR